MIDHRFFTIVTLAGPNALFSFTIETLAEPIALLAEGVALLAGPIALCFFGNYISLYSMRLGRVL
jgi:hypothetical protein